MTSRSKGAHPDHYAVAMNPIDGFAPATLRTTTNGLRYILECLKHYESEAEAPELALHRALETALEAELKSNSLSTNREFTANDVPTLKHALNVVLGNEDTTLPQCDKVIRLNF